MKRIGTLVIALFVFGGFASGSMAKDTKGMSDKVQTCKAKMGAKTIPQGQRKSEYEKCMSDPMNYQ